MQAENMMTRASNTAITENMMMMMTTRILEKITPASKSGHTVAHQQDQDDIQTSPDMKHDDPDEKPVDREHDDEDHHRRQDDDDDLLLRKI